MSLGMRFGLDQALIGKMGNNTYLGGLITLAHGCQSSY